MNGNDNYKELIGNCQLVLFINKNNERQSYMQLTYKKAIIDDIDILTKTRIKVLRSANNLSNDVDMSEIQRQSYEYYKQAFKDSTHIAYLVFNENEFVAWNC